jgi:hypothetical protein
MAPLFVPGDDSLLHQNPFDLQVAAGVPTPAIPDCVEFLLSVVLPEGRAVISLRPTPLQQERSKAGTPRHPQLVAG